MAAILHGKIQGSFIRTQQVKESCGIQGKYIVVGLCGIEDDGTDLLRYNNNKNYFSLTNNKNDLLVCNFNINPDTMLIDDGVIITCPECIKQIKKLGY